MWRKVLVGMALIATACARSPARDPAVVDDVVAYVAKIKQWEPVEAKVLQAIHDVRQSQYVDDDYVVSTLGGTMADVEIHLDEIERYHPRTTQVTEVHNRYRKAWHDLHDAFAGVIAAMNAKDYRALSTATAAMGRARSDLVTVAAAISLLMKETGLKSDEQEAAAATRVPVRG